MRADRATIEERPAAFLDRDGVINVDLGYVFEPERLALTPTAAEGIRLLNAAGHHVLVATNQSGLARGLFTLPQMHRFHDALRARLAAEGARIDAIYFCGHHADGIVPAFTGAHEDRKPNPGMLLRAMEDWSVRRAGSFMIGDKPSDAEAARRAGIPCHLVPRNDCDLAAVVRRALLA